MALSMEVNGILYEDALNISVSRSMHNLAGFFEANATANNEELIPVKIGDAIRIFADGTSILNGFVEALEINYDSASHSIYLFGRDRTGDMFDSTVSGPKTYIAPNSFSGVLRSALDAGNMSYIGINNQATDAPDFTDGERLDAEVGQTIHSFLDAYARKLQIVMTTDENGDVLLARAGTVQSGLRLSLGGNIKSASFKKKYNNIFNKYIARSQIDPLSSDDTPAIDVVSQTGSITVDNSVRPSRIIEFNTEEDADNVTSFNRAEFEANIRRANSINYSCVVQGHSVNGSPMKINTLAFVDDAFAGISSDLLIHSIEYSYSLNSGSTTKLQMTYKDAYTLNADRDAREAARQLVGDDY